MPPRATRPGNFLYRLVFPDWSSPRPVTFFMLENLLEARADSSFPTGCRCNDEDVNVYLAHLLTEHLVTPRHERVQGGSSPLLHPPARNPLNRSEGVEHYRRNGDHRLISLGLYGRGDLCRRRQPPWGWTREEIQQRDLVDGRSCYSTAVNLLRGKQTSRSALVPVLSKLAHYFDGYVHILQVLARRRFGLGTRLSPRQVSELATESHTFVCEAKEEGNISIDEFLDILSRYQKQPTESDRKLLEEMARRLGIDLEKILTPPLG